MYTGATLTDVGGIISQYGTNGPYQMTGGTISITGGTTTTTYSTWNCAGLYQVGLTAADGTSFGPYIGPIATPEQTAALGWTPIPLNAAGAGNL